MTTYTFSQVDVFAPHSLTGNPVAVVHDASSLTQLEMAAFARWTNLSETAFLLPPAHPSADYALRIFTPFEELPFAGHPTLGSAYAWLGGGGVPATADTVVQECGIGLVEVRADGDEVAFAAPELLRSGPVDHETLAVALDALGLGPDRVLRAGWVDNGPGWLGLQLASAGDVLDLRPDFVAMGALQIGVIGLLDAATSTAVGAHYEVRAFCPELAAPEDPVTGSLNAGLAVWLVREGHVPHQYVVRQGTKLGRDGRVRVSSDPDGRIWVGGTCRALIEGTLTL